MSNTRENRRRTPPQNIDLHDLERNALIAILDIHLRFIEQMESLGPAINARSADRFHRATQTMSRMRDRLASFLRDWIHSELRDINVVTKVWQDGTNTLMDMDQAIIKCIRLNDDGFFNQ